jgi:hypothetical protein
LLFLLLFYPAFHHFLLSLHLHALPSSHSSHHLGFVCLKSRLLWNGNLGNVLLLILLSRVTSVSLLSFVMYGIYAKFMFTVIFVHLHSFLTFGIVETTRYELWRGHCKVWSLNDSIVAWLLEC